MAEPPVVLPCTEMISRAARLANYVFNINVL